MERWCLLIFLLLSNSLFAKELKLFGVILKEANRMQLNEAALNNGMTLIETTTDKDLYNATKSRIRGVKKFMMIFRNDRFAFARYEISGKQEIKSLLKDLINVHGKIHEEGQALESEEPGQRYVWFFGNAMKIVYVHSQDNTATLSYVDEEEWALKLEEAKSKKNVKKMGRISISSLPPGALVHLEGEPIGKTPIENMELPLGDKVLRLTLEGYDEAFKEISVHEGRISSYDFVLSRSSAPIPPAAINLPPPTAARKPDAEPILNDVWNAVDFKFVSGLQATTYQSVIKSEYIDRGYTLPTILLGARFFNFLQLEGRASYVTSQLRFANGRMDVERSEAGWYASGCFFCQSWFRAYLTYGRTLVGTKAKFKPIDEFYDNDKVYGLEQKATINHQSRNLEAGFSLFSDTIRLIAGQATPVERYVAGYEIQESTYGGLAYSKIF